MGLTERNPESHNPKEILIVHRAILTYNGKFLIIKRSYSDRYEPGKWEFPGGKMRKGENLHDCLQNEIREEVGLSFSYKVPLAYFNSYVLDKMSAVSEKYIGTTYVSIFSVCVAPGVDVTLSEEHSDFAWVTLEEVGLYDLKKEDSDAISALESLIG